MATAIETQPMAGKGGGSNHRRSRTRDLVEPPPAAGSRRREIATGAAIVVFCTIAGVLWYLTSLDKMPVVALANAVDRGETIGPDDLRLTYISTDGPTAWLDASARDQLVGRIAIADLPAGTLLTGALVVESETIGPEEGMVGLSMEPGQYPAGDLAPGDVVNVVTSPSGATQPAGEPVIGEATVLAVDDLASADRKLVSLLASEPVANAIAAVDPSALRLVVVSP